MTNGPLEYPAREPLSVVYPTCGRAALLARSVTALLANDPLPDQIIVVDQSQETATKDALAALNCPCIVRVPSTEKGLSNARNTGILAARNPLIGFLDDDCIPAPNWTTAIAAAIRQFPASSVWIGKDFADENDIRPEAISSQSASHLSLRGMNDPWSLGPTGGNSAFRRAVFDAVGMFDPLLGQGSVFPGAEDGDMIFRVLRHGFQVTYTDTIRCWHVGWRSEAENVVNSYKYGVGIGAMMAKFVHEGHGWPMARIFVRRFLAKYLSLPWFLLVSPKRKFRHNAGWARGFAHGYRGWRNRDGNRNAR